MNCRQCWPPPGPAFSKELDWQRLAAHAAEAALRHSLVGESEQLLVASPIMPELAAS